MSMFDRIKGRFKKGDDSSASSEESFDLDDDALFGSGDSLADDGLGTLDAGTDDFGDDAGLDTFGTMSDEGGDIGAAGTADFEGFDDLGDSLGGESFGDDFGDAAVDVDDGAPAKGKKKKKAKKAKKAKAGRRPGAGKVLGITIGAGVGGLVLGLVGGTVVQRATSPDTQLRAEIEKMDADLKVVKSKLDPLTRVASPEEVAALQQEMATRTEQQQVLADIDTKIEDRAEQERLRDEAARRRDAAAEALAVREASLANIGKEAQQIELRVRYLEREGARLAQETLAHDEAVRRMQSTLPAAYTAAATADATRTLSVQVTASP